MLRVDPVKPGETGSRERLLAALRKAPRALREDLWTVAADPMPRMGEPGYPVWRPVFWLVMVMFAAFVAVFSVSQFRWYYQLGDYATLLGLAQAVALVVAMSRPVPAWWAVTIAMVTVALVSEPNVGPGQLYPWAISGVTAQAGVLLLLALRVRPRVAVEALTISVLAGLACSTFFPRAHNDDVPSAVAILAAAVVVGTALRGRRMARTELVVQAEITSEERARRTLLEERNRIARELHDVVAHHMSVISIQAQVAPHLVENPSEELKENLAGIRENAVEALTELRRVLGVLRSEDALPEGARHAPQPTLDRLDELVGKVRGAGLTIATETRGKRRPLPPGVELSAFRIVQEALSNVMRHAPGAEVRVEIGYRSTGITIRVTNTAPDRPVTPSQSIGHGLLGMRERTAMLDGEFSNGPTPEGGYEVAAMLPLEDSS
ncbi:sensor histidine kinase [Actinacidiphila oryziradicis]|uniref:histidine kinase n=1 Tax=Actinacidiphila oryziradicis TaxID=2571141 RepID=A0A4U0SK87_9ACTN|nr:sensor histidine kinase [Actinacidiphila oryziradicis]